MSDTELKQHCALGFQSLLDLTVIMETNTIENRFKRTTTSMAQATRSSLLVPKATLGIRSIMA